MSATDLDILRWKVKVMKGMKVPDIGNEFVQVIGRGAVPNIPNAEKWSEGSREWQEESIVTSARKERCHGNACVGG